MTVPGVNPDEFVPGDRIAARRAVGLPADERPLVLFCGHDFERKGLDHAIRATAASRTGFGLVVVGHHEDQRRFETLARTCAVRDRVHFLGAQSSTAPYFQASDVFVLPSRADIWGVTVIEAMACGIPPVASRDVGSSTVIEEGRTGFVLPDPSDAQRLAATLDAAVSDPDRETLMATRCRATALRYSWEEHGRLVEGDLEGRSPHACPPVARPRQASTSSRGGSARSGSCAAAVSCPTTTTSWSRRGSRASPSRRIRHRSGRGPATTR